MEMVCLRAPHFVRELAERLRRNVFPLNGNVRPDDLHFVRDVIT
jgi:hypothetical protein